MFRSLRHLLTTNRTSLCFLSFLPRTNYDNPNPSTNDPENGFERVQLLFQLNKYGEPRKEMLKYAELCLCSAAICGFYGAFRAAKVAYEKYIEEHVVSSYVSPADARRKLQNYVSMSFARNFLIWSVKGVSITACFLGIILVVSAYRGKDGILEFIPAGLITALLIKSFSGFKGMITAGVVGTASGLMFGGMLHGFALIENFFTNDVRDWQEKRQLIKKEQLMKIEEANASQMNELSSHTKNMGLTTSGSVPSETQAK